MGPSIANRSKHWVNGSRFELSRSRMLKAIKASMKGILAMHAARRSRGVNPNRSSFIGDGRTLRLCRFFRRALILPMRYLSTGQTGALNGRNSAKKSRALAGRSAVSQPAFEIWIYVMIRLQRQIGNSRLIRFGGNWHMQNRLRRYLMNLFTLGIANCLALARRR
jgi:hypothetical protein